MPKYGHVIRGSSLATRWRHDSVMELSWNYHRTVSKDTREVLTARDWPTWETSAKSINQLSPPETGRREQLLATVTHNFTARDWPTRSYGFS
ncbi:14126_t:CDS:2 [Ambispora leptoticha]|uniref:14126_t:CDS:1 n=1 Tax=Ambispora leptoticha TaxID=144679 RepID=A0A9N9CS42_9GLOM|nr:14126_t:CDS:2 [Ambispora leptoticha]